MSPVTTVPLEDATDTEITLGTGKMLALFFGLVILCAIFFGMGFTMGKSSVRSAPELLPSPSTSSPRTPAASRNTAAPSSAPESHATEQSQPATPAGSGTASASNQSAASSVPDQPAASIPGQQGQAYYVQVAAVSKQEDAEALVESLKGRQYSAFIASPGSDKLFHVQVGPFSDVKQAEDTRAKLVSDGYNPILKK
jgi:cell division septation protein DedD